MLRRGPSDGESVKEAGNFGYISESTTGAHTDTDFDHKIQYVSLLTHWHGGVRGMREVQRCDYSTHAREDCNSQLPHDLNVTPQLVPRFKFSMVRIAANMELLKNEP